MPILFFIETSINPWYAPPHIQAPALYVDEKAMRYCLRFLERKLLCVSQLIVLPAFILHLKKRF
jgi:hypothetical protein